MKPEVTRLVDDLWEARQAGDTPRCIEICRQGMQMTSPDATEPWFVFRYNLAVCLLRADAPQPEEDCEAAISLLTGMLPVLDATADRDESGAVLLALGKACDQRSRGDRQENLENALACFTKAASTFTVDEHPREWAFSRTGMGMIYADRTAGDLQDNLQKAIACFENSLRVFTKRAHPEDWRDTMNRLDDLRRRKGGLG